MAALGFSSNFGSLQQQTEPDYLTSTFPQTCTAVADIAPELLAYNCPENYAFSDTFTNPLYEFDEPLYTDSYNNLLPYFSSPSDNLISLSPEIFPLEDFDYSSCQYQFPKRQKISYDNHYYPNPEPVEFVEGCIANITLPAPELLLPEIPASPVPKFDAPTTFNVGRSGNDQPSGISSAKKPSGVSLSAQSIAARERRRKITEKTQELGKLIPGGSKMNTAEMFQAASKYVKFLQAQLKMLELMDSIKEGKQPLNSRELQVLLGSPSVQEKLYSQEKCLVPREFVQAMANDQEIRLNSVIIQEMDQFLGTNIGLKD